MERVSKLTFNLIKANITNEKLKQLYNSRLKQNTMKRDFTIFFLLISLSALAQFPSPTNFSLQGQYIELDQCMPCLSTFPFHDLCGPTYCSSFSWQAPTETTTATFDHYNIYGKYENQIVFSATKTTISH